jgi:hypothetical protein
MGQKYTIRDNANLAKQSKAEKRSNPALRISDGEQQDGSVKERHPSVADALHSKRR